MAESIGTAARSEDWDRHWSAYADTNTLNPAQAYRRTLIFQHLGIAGAPAPVRVLEIGCGQGDLSLELTARHPEIEFVGLDLSPTGLQTAGRRVPSARFFEQDLMRPLAHPQLVSWATHAICSEVLEHVADPVAALINIRAALAPGCRLVITVPGGPMSAFDKHIGHLRHFTPNSLAETLRAAGFDAPAIKGAGFPFFNLYRLAVIGRGEGLIAEAAGPPALATRLAMHAFGWLFKLNTSGTQRGWQLLAVATPRNDA